MHLAKIQVGNQVKQNPVILRVLVSETHTRIDFGYAAPWMYVKGGWIHISKDSFIKRENDEKKYALLFAENIPIAPDQFHFESKEDWRVFSLFFEPIDRENCRIDIIEKENGNEQDFNFHTIQLDFSEKIEAKTPEL